MKTILPFVFLLACTAQRNAASSVTAAERRALEAALDRMEDGLEEKRPLDVAGLYLDNGYLLAPGSQPVTGRAGIDRYWSGIAGVKSWELETLATSRRPEDLYAHAAYQRLKNKPPGWTDLGLDVKDAVYQLGTSDLRYLDRQGKEATSKVTYILVWKRQADGAWKILVDTFSGG